jgi:hypothetical protein
VLPSQGVRWSAVGIGALLGEGQFKMILRRVKALDKVLANLLVHGSAREAKPPSHLFYSLWKSHRSSRVISHKSKSFCGARPPRHDLKRRAKKQSNDRCQDISAHLGICHQRCGVRMALLIIHAAHASHTARHPAASAG